MPDSIFLRCAVLTVSAKRAVADDSSRDLLAERQQAAGGADIIWLLRSLKDAPHRRRWSARCSSSATRYCRISFSAERSR